VRVEQRITVDIDLLDLIGVDIEEELRERDVGRLRPAGRSQRQNSNDGEDDEDNPDA
jgi:hypothetical protein